MECVGIGDILTLGVPLSDGAIYKKAKLNAFRPLCETSIHFSANTNTVGFVARPRPSFYYTVSRRDENNSRVAEQCPVAKVKKMVNPKQIPTNSAIFWWKEYQSHCRTVILGLKMH